MGLATLLVAVLATAAWFGALTAQAGSPGVFTFPTEATVIDEPMGIATGPDDNLWVTTGDDTIRRVETDGTTTTFGDPALDDPRHLTFGPDANLWFTNFSADSVGRINPDNSFTFFPIDLGPGQHGPWDITAGPDGNLWFTNSVDNSIGRITPVGVVTRFTSPSISGPRGITVGSDANLWFTNEGSDSIGRITTAGVVSVFTGTDIDEPHAIVAGPDDALWFTNRGNDSIGRMSVGGMFTFTTNYTHPSVVGPHDIGVGTDGNLWFTNLTGHSIGRITTSGHITDFSHPTVGAPWALHSGPDGALWFTNSTTDRIGRLTVWSPSGQLRVTTDPPLPATIAVDGVVRDAWGLNWVDVDPGSHEVCFGEVPGYSAPDCETITVTAGQTTEVTGVYQQRGTLRVVTDPPHPGTILVDGLPRNDWGLWTDVDPGTYQVCFGLGSPGFAPSPCQTVEVTAGQTTEVTGTYTPTFDPTQVHEGGYLRVTTLPARASRISVNGHWTDTWGLTWMKIGEGTHTICWEDVPAATTPPCFDAVVTGSSTVSVTGVFGAHGYLRVLTDPPVGATLYVDGQPANAWGAWMSRPPGPVEVCFGEVPGLAPPPCQTGNVTANETLTVTGTYVLNLAGP